MLCNVKKKKVIQTTLEQHSINFDHFKSISQLTSLHYCSNVWGQEVLKYWSTEAENSAWDHRNKLQYIQIENSCFKL